MVFDAKNYANLGSGVGLRPKHFDYILENKPPAGWFEALTENYLGTEGRAPKVLKSISERYPVVLHGVSMSIGGTDPLNRPYLENLKALAESVSAKWISDHLCWTGVSGVNAHDLFPLPYNEATLKHVIQRVREVQDLLEQPILLENPSSYLSYKTSTMTEWEFLSELAIGAGCGLLLDVNNVYISAKNQGFDPLEYIDGLPASRVGQFHIAGHTVYPNYILDSHIGPVPQGVWQVFEYAIRKIGKRSSLLEWDEKIPDFNTLLNEASKMDRYLTRPQGLAIAHTDNRQGSEL